MGRKLLGELMGSLRLVWLDMLEVPWPRKNNGQRRQLAHWLTWLVGWAWTLAGLVLGALAAPPLLEAVGLANASYNDWLVIAFAVLTGFFVQLLGWIIFTLFAYLFSSVASQYVKSPRRTYRLLYFILAPGGVVILLLPLAGVGYGIYLYLTLVGTDQSTVTIAFVGSLLIKTFLIPLIKGIVTGALFRWFMKWLRGGKDTKKAD